METSLLRLKGRLDPEGGQSSLLASLRPALRPSSGIQPDDALLPAGAPGRRRSPEIFPRRQSARVRLQTADAVGGLPTPASLSRPSEKSPSD